MDFTYLFEFYENLVIQADQAFQKMADEYPSLIKCEPHCSDCCHALFGLFLIEAVFLKNDFDRLGEKERSDALLRAQEADKEFAKLEQKLKTFDNDPQMREYAMARERIRCPLLDDNHDCILYPYRPITCRVYGIPTAIHGKAHICNKAGFTKGKSYPAFDLDGVYKELYSLTGELLGKEDEKRIERASLLISVSKAISTPLDELLNESS